MAEPRLRVAIVFALYLIGLYLAAGPAIHLAEWHVTTRTNQCLNEAYAWRKGRLDLPLIKPDALHDRQWDTAYVNGKSYNVFPPFFTFVGYVALTVQDWQAGLGDRIWGSSPPDRIEQPVAATEPLLMADEAMYAPWYIALGAIFPVVAAFFSFRTVAEKSAWAGVLAAYWVLGTPVIQLLMRCRFGMLNEFYGVVGSAAMLVLAASLLGRRRIWIAAVALLIGMWTRQLTALYLPAAMWIVWRGRNTAQAENREWSQGERAPALPAGDREFLARNATGIAGHRVWRELIVLGVTASIGLGVLATLNWLKFGDPFNTGYGLIYEGRTDFLAKRSERIHGAFALDRECVARNAWYMNLEIPTLRIAKMKLMVESHPDGASIWVTSPLLLGVIVFARQWWRDAARRALMLSSLGVLGAMLFYHTTGSIQWGYSRFALDFMPIWLMVIAPYVTMGRWRWLTLGCLAWSALYFRLLSVTLAL